MQSSDQTGQQPMMRWHLMLHMFFAFYIFCFFVKGIYFLLAPNPLFSLGGYPTPSELGIYTLFAMLLAGIFGAIILWSYWVFFRRLEQRFARARDPQPEGRERWIGILGAVALLVYFAVFGREAWDLLRTGAFLLRRFDFDPSIYYSGEAGVTAFFVQIELGFLLIFTVYAVRKRRTLWIALAALFCLCQVILANGSRFTLLSSLLLVPTALYLCWWRRPHHYRRCVATLYVAVVALPLLAAMLLAARSTGTILPTGESASAIAGGALVTFDPIDHLINYLYLRPFDWTGTRPLEDFLQVVPRALYRDKPMIYGMAALQEQMYPGTKGAGSGTAVYGDYPLSDVVMALDFYLPVGLLLHGILTGAFLALLDISLMRRTLLGTSFFLLNFFFMLALIRSGIVNYTLGNFASDYIPLLLAMGLLYAGRYRLVLQPKAGQAEVTGFTQT